MNLIGNSFEDIYQLVRQGIPGGKQKAKNLFSRLYKEGRWEIGDGNTFELPPVSRSVEEGGTIKFLLKLEDGLETESIILPMAGRYNTLCLSSQIGCARACAFCETGKMGLKRNLSTGEILAQFMAAELYFTKPIRNIVFMGMGEAFDNFDSVMAAIDILTHPWAMNLPKKSICLSTVGNVDGIERLTVLVDKNPEKHYHKLHLAVSLNSADDAVRNTLMPVNRRWPLSELKKALMETKQYGRKDLLYFEYVLIKGMTDGKENGRKLIEFAGEFPEIVINLIPFNPGRNSEFEKPDHEEMNRFHRQILDAGIRVYTRISQGERIMAACGQLGNRKSTNQLS